MDISLILWCTSVLYFVGPVTGQEKLVLKYQHIIVDLVKLMTNRASHPYKTISGTIESKDQIEELCMQSVISDYIFHANTLDNKFVTGSDKTDKLVQWQMDHIKSHFDQIEQIIPEKRRLSISLRLPIRDLDTITCYSRTSSLMETWALLDINDEGRYYIFSRSSLDYLRLIGRLEVAPEVDIECNVQAVLEHKFGSSLRSTSEIFSYDLCGVHQLNHFGACAQAAKFMNIQQDSKYKKHIIYSYEKTGDLCVRKGAIEYKSDIYNGVYENLDNHKLGILPCAVNTDWSKPQFYIFNDQFEKNVLYILKIVLADIQHPVFSVEMRIKGVSSMNMHSPLFKHLFLSK